ncbi:MAG TPA: uroporphyrinogen decarboxylase family protein [Gaiellaceae bacterium]|nr:uroporphyrinogen decarboxylase family protein [Gaiellaceae bacterium]
MFDRVVCALDASPLWLEAVRQACLLGSGVGQIELVGVIQTVADEYSAYGAPAVVSEGEHSLARRLADAQVVCSRASIELLQGPKLARLLVLLEESDATLVAVGAASRHRGIGIVRGELAPEQAVVGFCGGPFTVAGYLVEGKPSREFAIVKTLMYREPHVWRALLDKLADCFAGYVSAQVRAGADVVQLFDSWVGALSQRDYEEFVGPWSARILAAVDVPTIHFGTGTATLLPAMARAGGDVIGLDWRIPLDEGWQLVPDRAVQGNLDPAVLLGPWSRVEAGARDVLARAGGRPGHIFNLGHGVLPRTEPEQISRLAQLVQALPSPV